MARLTAAEVQTLGPGRHSDGGTLTLLVSRTGGRSWVQRMMIAGRRCDIGLGPVSVVTVKMARQRALANRQAVWAGTDPRDAKRRTKAPTFREACEHMMTANAAGWRGEATAATLARQMQMHTYGVLGKLAVDRITQADVLRALAPILIARPTTGRRVRQACRATLAWAQAAGHVAENVADGRIDAALPKPPAVKVHRKATPYREVGDALRAVEAATKAECIKACFALIVLTACRSGEARLAEWSEFDLERGEWTIPAKRTKNGRPHRIPLSIAALAILDRARRLGGERFVFPSPAKPGAALARPTLLAAVRRAGITADIHGFRSSFRDWCSEQTDTPREVCEAALAHQNGDETERAYFRSDLYEKRRELMRQWAAHVLVS